ncbi:MAG: WYL domain-containing protein [Intrasporangium sp.]|uniref:helix-turn-helix transcriptional regulator n=1 Tax=Intrasporangium sp. TaxID=1925024 RepID=UPI002648111A|nr:WYL domain-containing protein [Intrasporangium sp.]MDN5796484.1 WYL domain-containing protein [Intrasporangium sp.]
MRADRLLRLLMLLQRYRRATAGWLAAELEVSERTVLRDIGALSVAGVPVYTERGRGGGCVLLDDFTTRASGLTPAEAQALFAWASRETVADLGLGADLASALAKIAATAPSVALEQAEAMGGVVIADRRRWFAATEDVPWLPTLREAASQGRRVRVRYTSAEAAAPSSRTLDPIGVVDNSGRWYLVAEHRRRVRTYRVSRVSGVTILDQPATLVDGRPLAQIWAERRRGLEDGFAPLEVTVSVDPADARRIRRLLSMQLAPGTAIVDAPAAAHRDESACGRLVWRLSVRQPPVIVAMAVMAAPQMIVLSPTAIHAEIHAGAKRALEYYPPGDHE